MRSSPRSITPRHADSPGAIGDGHRLVEPRDAYSTAREVIGYTAYLAGARE
jgi:hypothetical protein